jgi:uncharacterized protein
VIYLDSSAVVKLAHQEQETPALRSWLAEHAAPLVVSALARTESARALRRADPGALPALTMVLAVMHQHPVSEAVLDAAAALPGEHLRSLDAIHLATAESLGDGLQAFVAYDKRLADAARHRGLAVAAPA